ncbi:MAG: DUF1540 domain-containing protein [Oscillospiraceae bacterium]
MTILNCDCKRCINNSNNLCCRPNLYIKGELSSVVTDTFCENFCCKSEGVMTNLVYNSANKSLDVNCLAKNCIYNNKTKCEAESIAIQNFDAYDKTQTYCSSFKIS